MSVTAVATNASEDGFKGPFKLIYQEIQAKLNESLKLHIVGLYDFGKVLSETNGTGMIGSLLRNESQFSVCPMPLTKETHRYLDYTSVLTYDDWVIASGKPIASFRDHFSSLTTFDSEVWLAMLASFVAVLLFSIFAKSLVFINRRKKESKLKSFCSTLLLIMRVLVRQDVSLKKRHQLLHQRILLAFWMLGCFCISASFMGCILARFAKAESLIFYEKVEDFLDYPEVKLFLVENLPLHDDLKFSSDPMKIRLWNKVLKDKSVFKLIDVDFSKMLEDLTQGKIASPTLKRLFMSAINNYCEMFQENPPILSKQKLGNSDTYTLFTRKGIDKELRRIVNFVVSQIAETNLINALLDRTTFYGELCLLRDPPELSPLPLIKLYLFMILYIVGMSLAIVYHVIWFTLVYRSEF